MKMLANPDVLSIDSARTGQAAVEQLAAKKTENFSTEETGQAGVGKGCYPRFEFCGTRGAPGVASRSL